MYKLPVVTSSTKRYGGGAGVDVGHPASNIMTNSEKELMEAKNDKTETVIENALAFSLLVGGWLGALGRKEEVERPKEYKQAV